MHRNRHRTQAPLRQPRSLAATIARSAVVGALGGLTFAALMVAIGLVRAAAFWLVGKHFQPINAADVRALERYAASFAVGGFVVGLAGPWLHRRVIRHLAFYVGGIVTYAGLGALWPALVGGDRAMTLMIIVPFGTMLGLFGLYVFEHEWPSAAGLREPPAP